MFQRATETHSSERNSDQLVIVTFNDLVSSIFCIMYLRIIMFYHNIIGYNGYFEFQW